jgi:hypothetical protein
VIAGSDAVADERGGSGGGNWLKQQLGVGNVVLIVTLIFTAGIFYQRTIAMEEELRGLRDQVKASREQATEARDQSRLLAYQVGSLSDQVRRMTDELQDIRRDTKGRFQ